MIDEQTLLAYEQTDYKFSDITINIGVYSDAVKQLLIPYAPLGAIFITAWNPMGKVVYDEQNHRANKKLKSILLEMGLTVIDGYGISPCGSWREDSFFAYPIDKHASQRLCEAFSQNAVVYVDNNGYPNLIFHS